MGGVTSGWENFFVAEVGAAAAVCGFLFVAVCYRVIGMQSASIPFLVTGIGLLAGNPRAIAWVVPGAITSFFAAMLNAWVLLVEIQR